MAGVFQRGPSDQPRFYARVKSADGQWISRRVRQPTREAALEVARAMETKFERQSVGLEPFCAGEGELKKYLDRFAAGMRNKDASSDCARLVKYVYPVWSTATFSDLATVNVERWIDGLDVTASTAQKAFGLLSRFCSWLVSNKVMAQNPCRDVDRKKVPVPVVQKPRQPVDLYELAMRALPDPFRLMFYVGNRVGLRLGQICSLEIGDLDISARVVTTRTTTRAGESVVSLPMPSDVGDVLGPWVDRRKRDCAGGCDRVFVDGDGDPIDRHAVQYRWKTIARLAASVATWAEATDLVFKARARKLDTQDAMAASTAVGFDREQLGAIEIVERIASLREKGFVFICVSLKTVQPIRRLLSSNGFVPHSFGW